MEIPGVPTKYKCSACSEHIQDISTHLISRDHGGPFKIGLYTTDNLTKQSGYVSLKFANFTFEQLKKYSVNGYRIIINEERKLKFESELETCKIFPF